MNRFQIIDEKRPFLIPTVFLSVLLIGFMIAMRFSFPQTETNGFSSFIIAFEFARSIQDIYVLFRGFSKPEIIGINQGNYIDFGFMITYSVLIGFVFYQSSKEFKRKWLKSGVLLSFFIFTCDFFENVFLLKITGIYLSNENETLMIPLLEKLNVVTWLKWGSLAFTFFIFYEVLVRLNWFYKISGLVLMLPFLFMLATKEFTPEKISLFTSGIFGCFFILILFGITYKKRLPG